jgi:tRNA A-37 threonylcarbamoyl transferase component Bud32/HAMP domain-containing protein
MKWIFSIRTKLFALVFSAFFILIAAIYWQIGAKAESVAAVVIDRSLTQSSRILDTRIASRFRFIQEMANGLARDGRILPLVADKQSLTLQDLSLEYKAVYDFDILFFMDDRGTILARSDQPNAIGVNLAGKSSLFDEALNGQLSSGFIVSQGKLMQTVAAPIFDNVAQDVVKGTVVLAYELSRETAQEIVALTESHIGFFTFTRDDDGAINGVQSSYTSDDALSQKEREHFSDNPSAWQDILESKSDELRNRYSVDNSVQHNVFRRINSKDGNPLGFIVAMRSAAELKRPFEDIKKQLLMIGSFCLVLASLFAGLMAHGMSRPIIRLVDMTKLIQGGFYPSDEYKSGSLDEIGLLQNALVRMGQSLREKAEFEAYLAELADEIESDNSVTLHAGDIADEPVTDEDDGSLSDELNSIDNERTIIQSSNSNHATRADKQQIIDGRYRVLSQLGTGTMGVVYMATDLDLDEKIAVKVIQKNLFKNIEGLNFKEEIRLARKITHRNIVRTFDFGSSDSELYITMEYVQGYDLGRLITKKGALDFNIGMAIAKQICSAMIAAHQMGIIHRDLKPSNMIINRQGILKIMDFGLAMQVKAPSAKLNVLNPSSHSDLEETNTGGAIMGTPRYMAPEQFAGSLALDARTDIYAIGIIMFTIFSGKPPFSAPDFHQLAAKHTNDPVPEIKGRHKDMPAAIRDIIHRALAKKPQDRFQSVREMLEQLNSVSVTATI